MAGAAAALVSVLFLTPVAASGKVEDAPAKRGRSFKYEPPKRGAPKVRVSSASRGETDPLPSLCVLAPDHVGLTVRARPRLFWYQSTATELPIVFSIAEEEAIDPLLEFTLRGSGLCGLVEVALADFGVCLDTDTEYRWVVAIVPDPNKRSRDVITEGRIVRVSPPDALAQALQGVGEEERAAVYAERGVWYDALAAINDRVRARPDDRACRQWRSDLLMEVDLPEPVTALAAARAVVSPQVGLAGSGSRTAAAEPAAAPTYVPVRRGAPGRLVSGATRAGDTGPAAPSEASSRAEREAGMRRTAASDARAAMPVLSVLAPDDVGLTTREQPVLFWYLSRAADVPFNLRVTGQDVQEPLCDITVRRSDCRGIWRLDLGKLGLSLAAGEDYQWQVSLLPDPTDRSKDVAVSSVIRRADVPPELEDELAGAETAERPVILARHGIWCDALAELSDMIEADPANGELRRRRVALLEQVGLKEAAASDLPAD